MAGTGKKWAIGCGIGCGFMLLLLGGVGTCGYIGVRRIVDKAEGIEESFDALDAELGHPRDYSPDPTGEIPAERMEVFLAVRQEMAPANGEAEQLMAQLDDGAGMPGPAMVLGKIRAGMQFIPAMLAFVDERNRVLLKHEMGLGEYQYIYTLAFFGQLDKNPADGPGFRVSDQGDEDHQTGPVRWGVTSGDGDSDDVRGDRDREVRRYLNKSMGLIASNQLNAVDRLLADRDDEALRQWREELAAEVSAMDREPRRILWEEGLPEQLRDSLEPYRDRLEESYAELMNVVELGLVNHQ
jgi:hypothetical protein